MEHKIYRSFLLLLLFLLPQSNTHGQQIEGPLRGNITAIDGLGRQAHTYPAERPDRQVGIFYFIWQGAHGYDRHSGALPDEGVMKASETDTLSPYDISKMLAENPDDPQYGPDLAFHYWGEPYLGYYLPDDEWIIRKHAQMIVDAGIDVIIIDVTNAHIYLPQVKQICEVYTRMRTEGNRTPDIAFIINSRPRQTLDRLYENFYAKGLYRDMWYMWKGKPLLLCPPEGISPETEEFFSVRHSWFASSWEWFADGKDKWPWADFYPQGYGWHESPDIPEAMAVCAATHPTSNIGRSHYNNVQPQPGEERSAEGPYFAQQFERALEVDPEFIFITGWNEWVAMRFTNGAAREMMGKPIQAGDTYFVDQYNEEFSRDIEPMRGGFGDSFYYQMADFVKRYKGAPAQQVSGRDKSMKIDGKMNKWQKVRNTYTDDRGDIVPRDHAGWGRFRSYTDYSGRNDIVESKVACDGKNLYFYVRTADNLTPWNQPMWMRLFIGVENSGQAGWEGFTFMVNDKVYDGQTTTLKRNSGGWNWEQQCALQYRTDGNEMELAVPLPELGLRDEDFTIHFKWIDNAVADGDIMECIDKGDSAPNGRFRYVYNYNPKL